jgi:peroxiredoxin
METKVLQDTVSPNFTFETPWKSKLLFHDVINDKNAILIFLRYIGCPICQLEMANIKNTIIRGENKNTIVFIILQSIPSTISSITNEEDWPFTIICDPNANIFKLYKVNRGNIFRYLHPKGIIALLKSILKGYKHGKFEGIETQLPAAFVISNKRKIVYEYYGKSINDVPSLKYLVQYIN